MKIGEWCEAQNLKATALAKTLEEEGVTITRQSLAGIITGKKEAPLGVALALNDLSGGLITLREMILSDDEPVEKEEEKTEVAEDLDDLLASL